MKVYNYFFFVLFFKGSIVVYGSTIASLITIHHILDQWGIAGARVTWVQPDAVSLFPSSIQITLEDVLKCARVKILQGYTFDRYETITTDQEGKDNLVGAVFIKQEYKEIDEITVHCNVSPSTIHVHVQPDNSNTRYYSCMYTVRSL